MKKLLCLFGIIITFMFNSANAATKETNVCIYNPTQLGSALVPGDRRVWLEDNAGVATNKMWDGTTSRPNYSSGKWLSPGEHFCQRVEINKSSGTHDMYFFYIGIYKPKLDRTIWNMVTMNIGTSFTWGVATSWSIDSYGKSMSRPSIKHYAGDYDSFLDINVPQNFIPAASGGCSELGENKTNCSRFDIDI